MPGPKPVDVTTDVSETWRAYQAEDHERKVELIQVWFAVAVMGMLTAASLAVVLWPGMPADEVKVACGWIGAVLGAAANTLRKP